MIGMRHYGSDVTRCSLWQNKSIWWYNKKYWYILLQVRMYLWHF